MQAQGSRHKETEGGSLGTSVVECVSGKVIMKAGWTVRKMPGVIVILILS